RSCRETRVRHIRRAVVYRWHPTEMNAPAEAFRCQALAKEIAAELRAKYDLKAACLPVNVCLLRSSIMIRAIPIAHRGPETLRDGRWSLAVEVVGATRARCSRAFRSTEGRPSSARRTGRRKFT